MKNNNITTTIRTLLTAAAILIAPAVSSISLRAQSFEPFSPYGIFSPSAESYQMTRCGNLLPSLYTGAMNFSLPLMTYSDPDFTIPVTLEYSFDGYKPGLHSGTVGYGWYLDCGGVITREVRGIPDEGDLNDGRTTFCQTFGWRHAGSYRDSLDLRPWNIFSIRRHPMDYVPGDEYVGLLEGYDPFSDTPVYASSKGAGQGYSLYDTAPDIYHFRFLGHSGDFMMMPDGTVRVYNSDIPHGELSVTFSDNPNHLWQVAITLTDGEGYRYLFEPEGQSETPDQTGNYPANWSTNSVSGYRLVRITAPNERCAYLTYTHSSTPVLTPRYATLFDGICATGGGIETDNYYGAVSGGSDAYRWVFVREPVCRLDKVTIPVPGKAGAADSIVFHYVPAPGNEHAASCFGHSGDSFFENLGRPSVLTSVSMHGQDGLADSATLTYVMAPAGTPKTFLRSVTGMKSGTYTFGYDLSGFTLPPNDTQNTDHWGYWNGASISDLREHLVETAWMYVQEGGNATTLPDHNTDSTYVLVLPDTTIRRRVSPHLYAQMADAAKEADATRSSCGALTHIHYPHGGATVVSYEPNAVTRRMNVRRNQTIRTLEPVDSLDSAATWIVGGVRVSSLIDSTGAGRRDTTRFSYIDPESGGRGSGILMSMPKYAEAVQFEHYISPDYSSAGKWGHAIINAIGFNNCCGFTLDRDPHVVYPAVTVIHPDGSSTEHRFTSVADPGLGDVHTSSFTSAKHISGPSEWLENKGAAPTCMVPAAVDCRNLRGQPSLTVIRDASGRELRRTEYAYSYDQATVPFLCFNNILTFDLAPYTVRSPQLVSTVETERGVTVRTDRSYNALGQISVTSVTQSPLAGGGSASPYGTVSVKMRYRHETGDTSQFRTLPDAAARTRTCGTAEYLLAREHYEYRQSKWQLSEIRSFTPDTSALIHSGETAFSVAAGPERTSTFDYYDDGSDRLKKVTFPGGNTLNYTWTGNHITSKRENGPGNETRFDWKDQVGLTDVTAPSGQTVTYTYDSHNRPWKTLDADNLTVSVINYRLKNQ